MDKQDPEEQRLEEMPVEQAEDENSPSDEPVLSDKSASEPDEETASVTPSEDEAETDSADAEQDEPASEESVDDEADDVPVEEEPEEETETIPPVSEAAEEAPVDVEQEDEDASDASTEVESEAASTDEETTSEPEPDDDPSDWFVVHCYSGYENKVRHNLEQRIETMGMKDMIFDVVVPTQEEIEVRDGKRRTVERHIFPGYVLVNMILTEESWYVVRNTPGVTGFVGMGNNPTPLRPEEVAQIVKRMEADAPTVKVTFKVGERVRIVDGPFNDFRGVVSEIDMERTKVRVMVSFFGRETPVELDFLQVEKA
jgi:transcriptional antiterminator NusG